MDKIIIFISIAVIIAIAVLMVLICKISFRIENPYNRVMEDEEQMKALRKIKEKKYGK